MVGSVNGASGRRAPRPVGRDHACARESATTPCPSLVAPSAPETTWTRRSVATCPVLEGQATFRSVLDVVGVVVVGRVMWRCRTVATCPELEGQITFSSVGGGVIGVVVVVEDEDLWRRAFFRGL